MSTIRLTVVVFPGGTPDPAATHLRVEVDADPVGTLDTLIRDLLNAHGLTGEPHDWWFAVNGAWIGPAQKVEQLLRLLETEPGENPELQLIRGAPPFAPTRRETPPGHGAPDDSWPTLSIPDRPSRSGAPGAATPRPRSAPNLPPRPAPPAQRPPARAPTFDEPVSGTWSPADTAEGAALPSPSGKMRPRTVTRRATVRYYSRMNPDRMFPLLVILSAEQIAEVREKAVKQAESAGFQVETDSLLELEPVLPGCDCYPPRESLPVAPEPVTATFYVVPHVLGRVQGARVVVRQGGKILSEVPLDVKVRKQTIAVLCGLFGLAAPYLMMGLRSLKLDYESQKADGFPVYQRAAAWALENVRPEWVGFGLIGLAVLAYFAMRPKKRSVLWDIAPKPHR